jgi:Anaphase-promoting complex subunit 1
MNKVLLASNSMSEILRFPSFLEPSMQIQISPFYQDNIISHNVYTDSSELIVSKDETSLEWKVGNVTHLIVSIEKGRIITAKIGRFGEEECLICLDTMLRFYFRNGKSYLASLPCKVANFFCLDNGILIERTPELNDTLPTLFTLLHPLDEAKPVVIKDTLDNELLYFNGPCGVVKKVRMGGVGGCGLILSHDQLNNTCQAFKYEIELPNNDVEDMEIDLNDLADLPQCSFDRVSPISIQRDRSFRSTVEVTLLWKLSNWYYVAH